MILDGRPGDERGRAEVGNVRAELFKSLRAGDQRGFIHKKIFGGIKGAVGSVVSAITSGSLPTPASLARGAIGGFFGGGTRIRRPLQPIVVPGLSGPMRTRGGQSVVPQQIVVPGRIRGNIQPKRLGVTVIPGIPDPFEYLRRKLINGDNGGTGTALTCEPPLIDSGQGFCEFPGSPAGGTGEARMGRYGAALEPSFEAINKRVCLDGMVLGKDFLCYNKGSISNKERLWPKGRAPLLTGGQVNAIAKANAAKTKVARAYKQLGLGKTQRRLPAAHRHAKAATGVVSV